MRDHTEHIVLTREEAISKLLGHLGPVRPAELVSIRNALGRVSAEDLKARADVPNATCAQMDGIAVRFDDFAHGMPDTSGWKVGRDFGWANTGCAMPDGFDTAIPIEEVSFPAKPILGEDDPGAPTIAAVPKARGACCRERGCDFMKGTTVVHAHTRITPDKMALLAMCDISEVPVIAKPKVAFIPTGSELVPVGGTLPSGHAFETNGLALAGRLEAWGAEPCIMGCVPDDPAAIKDALLLAQASSDIVVICAGSSKGEHDYTMEVLSEMGEVFCHETNHGPGKHTSAAVIDGTPVLGLSGPPAGFGITADWYLKPLVDQLLFGEAKPFPRIKATYATPLKQRTQGKARGGFHGAGGPPPEDFFVICPVSLSWDEEQGLVATPLTDGPAPDLSRLDEADGYLELHPRLLHALRPGDEVEVELRYPYRWL